MKRIFWSTVVVALLMAYSAGAAKSESENVGSAGTADSVETKKVEQAKNVEQAEQTKVLPDTLTIAMCGDIIQYISDTTPLARNRRSI